MGYSSSSLPSSSSPISSKKTEGFHKAYNYMALGRKLDSRRCSKCRLFLSIIVGIFLILIANDKVTKLIIYYREIDFETSFSYRLNLNNFTSVVNRYRLGILDKTDVQPINLRYSNIGFLKNAIHPEDLNKPIGLLIIVKSATRNYKKREAIRKSWGDIEYLRKNALAPNLQTKLVFICGIPQDFVEKESSFPDEEKFNDIVLADFDDNYSNNTYKSILALKWATLEFPSDYQYLLLIDDDMYANFKNLIPFVRTLRHRKVYKNFTTDAEVPFLSLTPNDADLKELTSVPALGNGLYMGTVYGSSYPVRASIIHYFDYGRKWYVTLAEYPFNLYPPYVPGAAIFMAKKTVSDFYYASHFVEHFWIDDVFLGILAYKMGILPLHNPNFHSHIHSLDEISKKEFVDVMALHGFQCPAQMFDLWHSRNLKKAQYYYC